MNNWKRDMDSPVTAYRKDNKRLWMTGYFIDSPDPKVSLWKKRWTVADLIDNHYCNHRSYDSLEEAMEE